MTLSRSCAFLLVFANVVLAQPALVEPPEFPPAQPGPQAVNGTEGCFLLAQGVILPGDVDWLQVRIPRASSRTVVDVDFPVGSGRSALLAMVVNGTTGFNVADNNNVSRDALCGLSAGTSPAGSPYDSAVDLRETSINATINIAVTGAADTSFVGLHTEFFSYEVWVYALPLACVNDQSCSDGVACTVDVCDVDSGDCSNAALDSNCDDGNFCDGPEWCDPALGCRAGVRPVCQDDVDCTDDYCDTGLNECVFEPVDEWCENGMFCDGDEVCDPQAGCQAGEPVECDDDVACTVDVCDEDNFDCVHTSDNSACDDGIFCNGAETCDLDAGCVAGSDPCPGSTCRESDDSCVGCLSDGDCDDGVFCNGAENCDAQENCASGSSPCGQAMCRESDDRCVECLADSDCDDGDFCNGGEFCSAAGACSDGAVACASAFCRESDDQCVDCLGDSDCDDGVYCNGAESCGPAGNCAAGSDPCASSMCREADDQCVECLSSADCDDGQYCNGAENCDASGSCVDGGYPCGDSQCRESDDSCVECLADADCDDEVFCNGAESCEASGVCADGQAPCGADQCRESDDRCVECLGDADCNDGLFCNGSEKCDASGACTGGDDACGELLCSEDDDQCVECFGDSDCDDGLFCNGAEKCDSSGACAGGNSPCQSGEACNEESNSCVSSGFSMDVRPGVCPARIMTNVQGNLPVAIVGMDVNQIRLKSIRLSRVDGVGGFVDALAAPQSQAPHFDDVSAPANPCECSSNGPDGNEDLVVAFKLQKVIQALRLEKVKNGTQVELRVSGKLKNGTPFSATDCVIIQNPGRKGNGVSPQ